MHRRDFLDPRRLAEPAGQVLGALDDLRRLEAEILGTEKPRGEDPVLLRFRRPAMGTDFEVVLPLGTPQAHLLADAALDEIDRLEAQLTVYRADSEVAELNARAFREAMPVEEGLFALLQLCRSLWEETDRAFDVSVGALVKAWGFFRRKGRVPEVAERRAVRERLGMQHLFLDAENRTVRFRREGLELNFGSIGKGYALDRAGALLREGVGLASGLLQGGRSSVLALGDEPGQPGRGWRIGVLDPVRPERRLGILHLRDRGLATSAATFQNLEHRGRKLGHILDPRTCWPAEGLLAATVTAPSAAEADALATAFFILGPQRTQTFLERRPDVGAILLLPDGVPRAYGRAAAEFTRPE